jgi:two-component system response regulator HydG
VYDIGRQLLEQREPARVVRSIHAAVVEHMSPGHACILTVAEDGRYRPVSWHRLELEAPQEEWPLSHSVIEDVLRDGVAVLATDISQATRFKDAGSVERFRIRSVLCVPLGSGAPRGVIYLDSRSDQHSFGEEDLQFLTAVSLYATLALERTEEFARTSEALGARDEHRELLQGELLRHEIIGSSSVLVRAYDQLRRFARSGARVLLRGETGTGKELFARAYAANSARSGAPWVPVPIPALAAGLVESELFGHVRGAFTEATRDRKGRLELADRGVLFLDEVGDIAPEIQTKLLRFLDSGELFRVGDNQPRRVDCLIVSATNRPLEEEVAAGRFRGDLLARLGHPIELPPLRSRPDDVPELIAHFAKRFERVGRRRTFQLATLEVLRRHHWPFNIRELQQVVERSICLVDHDEIRPEDLPLDLRGPVSPTPQLGDPSETPRPLRSVVEEVERSHILRTLEFAGGNRRKAIELLGLAPETFYRRLEEYGLHKKDKRSAKG